MRTLLHAVAAGLRTVAGAPGLVALVWAVNLAAAVPLALIVGGAIEASVGHSLVAGALEEGFDTGWHGELVEGASPLVATFRPAVIGAGAFFENLERWWAGRLFAAPPALVAAGVLYALVWAFLLGGVLARFAAAGRASGERRAPFFAACGRCFPSFAALAAGGGVLYWLIYRLARTGFHALEEGLRDGTEERIALAWTLAGAAAVVALLVATRLLLDYAKIALVAEGRRNPFWGAWRGARFVAAQPLATAGLHLAFVVAGLALLALYALAAPGTGPVTWLGVLLALALGQLALAVKIALRLATLAGETALYLPPPGEPPDS